MRNHERGRNAEGEGWRSENPRIPSSVENGKRKRHSKKERTECGKEGDAEIEIEKNVMERESINGDPLRFRG